MQIISALKEIAENKIEILNNSYLRDKKYNEIMDVEKECTTKLAHANEMIRSYFLQEINDYKKYESLLKDIQKWLDRQQLLQNLLFEIGNMRYILAFGNESLKLCHSQYNNLLVHTNSVNDELKEWHKNNSEKFGINFEEHNRKASLFTIKKHTIGRINKNWAYSKLNEGIENLISNQVSIKEFEPINNDKMKETVKILKRNDEYYNLI